LGYWAKSPIPNPQSPIPIYSNLKFNSFFKTIKFITFNLKYEYDLNQK